MKTRGRRHFNQNRFNTLIKRSIFITSVISFMSLPFLFYDELVYVPKIRKELLEACDKAWPDWHNYQTGRELWSDCINQAYSYHELTEGLIVIALFFAVVVPITFIVIRKLYHYLFPLTEYAR